MRFQCLYCRGIVAVDDEDMGTDVQCGHCGEVVTVPLSRVATGAIINDFLILEEIGRGGMGIVYKAHQVSLDRPAALKVLAENYALNAEFVVGFIKEARAAAKLNHPHIVQAYAVGEDEGIYFFAMEYVDGSTMKKILKQRRIIPVDEAMMVIQQIAEALDYAWKEQQLIHRDIKPDNIMITKNNRAKLADLGLARVASDVDDSEKEEVMGTPQYISPEHLTGAPMDVRSDIYSLGATFFHLITGRFPFEGRTATEIARKHLTAPLRSPKTLNSKIPDSVCHIIQKMMAKDVTKRYQSAEELVEDLRLARRGKTPVGTRTTSKKVSTKTTLYVSTKSGKASSKSSKSGMRTAQYQTRKTKSSKIRKSDEDVVPEELIEENDEALTTVSGLLRRKEEAYKKKVVFITLLCVLIGLGAIEYAVWKIMQKQTAGQNRNMGGKRASQAHIKRQSPPSAPVAQSVYIRQINSMLNFLKNNPNEAMRFVAKCDKFIAENPNPANKAEREALERLMAKYVPIDESRRVKKIRKIYRKRYLEVLEDRKVLVDMELEKKREEEKKRKEMERKRAEQARRAAQLRKENERKKKAYIEKLKEKKHTLLRHVIENCKKRKYEEAKKIVSEAVEKEQAVTDNVLKQEVEKFVAWTKDLQHCIDMASKIWNLIYNGGKALKGVQIEIFGSLAQITYIRKGMLKAIDKISGRAIRTKLSMVRGRQFVKLLRRAAEKTGTADNMFFYFIVRGNFKISKKIVPDDKWKKFAAEMEKIYKK